MDLDRLRREYDSLKDKCSKTFFLPGNAFEVNAARAYERLVAANNVVEGNRKLMLCKPSKRGRF